MIRRSQWNQWRRKRLKMPMGREWIAPGRTTLTFSIVTWKDESRKRLTIGVELVSEP
jgi:hypothetical protein